MAERGTFGRKMKTNNRNLRKALADSIAFLRRTNSARWANLLTSIETKIANPSTEEEGRKDLENCFGGMGSLNDLYFCEQNENLPANADRNSINEEFNSLLDTLFREHRLAGRSWLHRLQWRYLEFKHRGELEPRIKKTFRRRTRKA